MHVIENPLRIDATTPAIQPLPCLVPYWASDNPRAGMPRGNGEGVAKAF